MADWLIPAILLLMLFAGIVKWVPVYDAFLSGAKSGLQTAMDILPALCAVLFAVALLTASGAMEALLSSISPVMERLGVPKGAIPVMLMRPFSGSATLALLERTLAAHGPDSHAGRVASTMMGSSETIFYTVSLYLGAAGIKRSRHAIPAALIAWLAGGLASAWLCKIWG